ncbi:hypothetical protein HDV02_003390 [Globomyces sp. JEL0801]|nr:hypothetical protein HDV02_003390 [Globomyces sp. JEL0801]
MLKTDGAEQEQLLATKAFEQFVSNEEDDVGLQTVSSAHELQKVDRLLDNPIFQDIMVNSEANQTDSKYPLFATSAEPVIENDKADYDIKLTMPHEEIKQTAQTMCETVKSGLWSVWLGIDAVSAAVADFFGVTAPRYEMYMEDDNPDNEYDPTQNDQQNLISQGQPQMKYDSNEPNTVNLN